MLQQIWRLHQEQQWSEILKQAPALLSHYEGEQLAWLHNILADAYEETAVSGREYRLALRHAEAALDAAASGSFLHTWTLQKVAAYRADLGFYSGAEQAALAFLGAVPAHPEAQEAEPRAWFAMGRARHYQGQFREAVACFNAALERNNTGALAERIALFRVWSLAQSGAPRAAALALPSQVQEISVGHWYAALAAVRAAEGDWQGARGAALDALDHRSDTTWHIFDTIQTAELYLILKMAAVRLGLFGQVVAWAYKAAAVLSCWNAGIIAALAPMLQEMGGDSHHAAASHGAAHGPSGYRRCSLTGTVG